jgi:hypothetical protein
MRTPDYLWVYIVYSTVTITVSALCGIAATLKLAGWPVAKIRRSVRIAGIVLFAWLGLAMLLSWLGLFRSTQERPAPLFPMAVIVPIVVGAILIYRSDQVKAIVQAVPQSWLVGFQCYRGLGAMFLVLNGLHFLPGEFALPAGFGDVLIGLLAVPVAALYANGFAYRGRVVALWNILGIADLVIAVTTGFLSAPGPLQILALDHPNYLMGVYPMSLIPTFAVPLSIMLHIASLTKLSWQRETALSHHVGLQI